MIKNKKKICVSIIATMLVISSLVSCGGTVNMGDLFSGEHTERSSDIHIATERIRTLNPAISFDKDYIAISRLIYSGLFTFDEALRPVADLAQSYEYAEDKKSITINLRQDVTWHDGESFTADDVKFSIDAYKYIASYNETPYASYVANIKSVTKADDYTVTITFGNDAAIGVENLTFPILPEHKYTGRSAANALRLDVDDFEPVGTGMYKVEHYEPLKDLTLAANESYYGTKATNRLIFTILSDSYDGFNLTAINDINLVQSETYDRETYITDKDLINTEYPSNVTEVVGFNMIGQYTSIKEFRQAIAYLIDNDRLLESVYYQNGVSVDSLFYPGYLGLDNTGDQYAYDTEKAKAMLEAAGCIDRDDDGYLENVDNADVEIRILADSANALRVSAAHLIKSSVESCGITAVIDFAEGEVYTAKLAAGEFDMFIGTCTINERYDLRPLLHSQYGNIIKWSNPTVDEITTAMVNAVSVNEKAQEAARLQGILKAEIPYYPIFCKTYSIMSTQSFVGEMAPMFNNPYKNSAEWYCELPL